MSSPALLLACNSLLALTTVSRVGQITARKPNQADPEAGSRRARASDILLTQDAYEVEPGWACRAKPRSGVGDIPPPGAALSLHLSTDPSLSLARGWLRVPARRKLGAARPAAECLSAAGRDGPTGGFSPGWVMGSREARGAPMADRGSKSRGRWSAAP